MDNTLLRANRATKVSSTRLAAFATPCFPPLATFGTYIQFAKIDRSENVLPLRVHTCVPHLSLRLPPQLLYRLPPQ